LSTSKAEDETGSKKEELRIQTVNSEKRGCFYFFEGASLCFGHTKTLLCEAKYPAGLI
ncbi:hypothetical protein EZS27_032643, partial [termite gut metagenome]